MDVECCEIIVKGRKKRIVRDTYYSSTVDNTTGEVTMDDNDNTENTTTFPVPSATTMAMATSSSSSLSFTIVKTINEDEGEVEEDTSITSDNQ